MLFLGMDDCRNIGAGSAIATKLAAGVECRLAAGLHVHRRAVAAHGAIHEVTKRFPFAETGPKKPPFLRFRFQIESAIPAHRAEAIPRVRTKRVLGQHRELAVRIDLPEPIGGAFGVVAELSFALTQRLLRAFELFDVKIHPDPYQQRSVARAERLDTTEEPAISSLGATNSKAKLTGLAGANGDRPGFARFFLVARVQEPDVGVVRRANVDA